MKLYHSDGEKKNRGLEQLPEAYNIIDQNHWRKEDKYSASSESPDLNLIELHFTYERENKYIKNVIMMSKPMTWKLVLGRASLFTVFVTPMPGYKHVILI